MNELVAFCEITFQPFGLPSETFRIDLKREGAPQNLWEAWLSTIKPTLPQKSEYLELYEVNINKLLHEITLEPNCKYVISNGKPRRTIWDFFGPRKEAK